MTDPKAVPGAGASRVLESDRRLSESVLWRLQREFFEQQGPGAWREGIVPHYITSNPFIANAYARVVLGFLRDCPTLDPRQPVHILELGAGSGRFAFHFLKRLSFLLRHSSLRGVTFRYVMTDFVESTVASWRTHPALRPFMDQGRLDFSRLDVESDDDLVLRESGETLSPGSLANPLVVLANYFFDGIPQDAFRVAGGRLFESRITVSTPEDAGPVGPDLLGRATVRFSRHPIAGGYYGDPDFDAILEGYRQRLTETSFLFPVAALRCVRRLRRLSGDHLLLLAGDRGASREEDLLGEEEPAFLWHGSFSLPVNFHALTRYVSQQNGVALCSTYPLVSLNVAAFLFGQGQGCPPETFQAFSEHIERFGPDDFFLLKKLVERISETMSLPEILSCLRLSGWDAELFLDCFPVLLQQAGTAGDLEREELGWAVRQVWDTYYPIGEQRDLAFCLGMLLYTMTFYGEALSFFQHSLRLHGPDASTAFNIALCHYELRQLGPALEWIDQSLSLDPDREAARGLRLRIEAELERQGHAAAPSSGPAGSTRS